MDFSTLLILGALWLVFNVLTRGKGTGQPPRPPAPPARSSPPPTAARSTDPTQREGSRLEALLRDLNRSLEEAAHASTSADESDEAVSLEGEVLRPERPQVDQDDLAGQVVVRRIAAGQARDGALTAADHVKFDRQIRQEPADHTAVRRYTARQLRDAVVWREILGPPVGGRDL